MPLDIARQPLVLVASKGDWAGRSFESVLKVHGYAVQRTTSGGAALDLARVSPPDVVIVEEQLDDLHATEFCRLLREDAFLGRAIPIIVTASGATAPRDRMAVYAAGAWDYCSQPLDVEVLLLKLDTFVEARRTMKELHASSLIDSATDLYSVNGMRRLSRELAARAVRGHEPLACVALTAAEPRGARNGAAVPARRGTWARTADLIRKHRRSSDIVGHLGNGLFAILAPDTDATGAWHLIGRLREAALQSSLATGSRDDELQLRVGYWAVADFAAADIGEADPVGLATAALAHVQGSSGPTAVASFDEIGK